MNFFFLFLLADRFPRQKMTSSDLRMRKQLNQADNTERGLKCQIIRRRNERDSALKVNAQYNRECCAFAVAGILNEEHIWSLVDNHNLWKQCNSASVGVKTTIGDYTNKQGKTMKVHYSENGHYIEKCEKGDDKPKNYNGNFKITRDRFRFMMNPEATCLTQLFVGRFAGQHVVESDSEDEAPLTAVAKKITKAKAAGTAAARN